MNYHFRKLSIPPKTGALTLALITAGCLGVSEDTPEAPRAGGAMTVFQASSHAYSFPAPDLPPDAFNRFVSGDVRFEDAFVTAPATVNGGLGPLYNTTSCAACHARDGRGRPPVSPGEGLGGLLFRIGTTGADAHGGPKPMPGYGGQIQTRALFGVTPEAQVSIEYRDSIVSLAGGESATLRVPTYTLMNLWTPLPEPALISPRVAPAVFGLGLLEAVPESEILMRADANDADGDGVSGHPNYVHDARANAAVIGRFGWKANNPTVLQQTAGAYNNDMGITTPYFPTENCAADRPECAAHAPDVDSVTLADVAFYVQSLAVPGRRDWDNAEVRTGERLFAEVGCAVCHAPTLKTGTVSGEPWRSNQTIRPYTDMLLHDMGAGLADGRPDYLASGSEWRTPPLWGLGLSLVVNGHTFLLHDGRARNILEAVLWHGGEAASSREAVRALSPPDRAALLAFMNSL